ncbi:MAG TPA: hybrid sensor histidine kinase/response regulator [Verrucomicrobiae bacterium]|nr:hybrid sensor histidine kinase/response regulator [Verrucomicrobiae bacterium]
MPLPPALALDANLDSPDSPPAEDLGLKNPIPQLGRPTLLVVDDEEGPRVSLKVIFGDEFNILMAEDGPSAIDLARQHTIDIAVLDIRMSGMSGIEVLERLRYLDPSIEAVMMTAFETTDTIRQALRLRACDYLNKPFDVAGMRAAVQGALKRRTLGSEVRTNEEKLGKLQEELQQARMDQEIVRTRGEIYASIIHDINGPLTVISGLLQIINQGIGDASGVDGEDLEMVKDRLKRITRQVTNCIEISRRYLSFLRQQSNGSARVWTNQILGDLGELLRVHPAIRNNQLLIHPLAEDVAVPTNGTDLIQILLNLTLNALQCSPQYHRVEIRGYLHSQALELKMFADGPEDLFINRDGLRNIAPLLALSVQDNGPGIAPEVMPRIFEPYFTTHPRSQGTGLGLSIVQRLLKESQGALQVHSKPGQGTIFTVYLPAHPPSPNPTLKMES